MCEAPELSTLMRACFFSFFFLCSEYDCSNSAAVCRVRHLLALSPPCRRLPRDSSEIESNEGTQASSWVLFVVAHVLLPALMLADLLAHRGTLREHYDLTRRAPHHPHDRPLKVGSLPAVRSVTPSTLSLPFYFVPWKIISLFFFFD